MQQITIEDAQTIARLIHLAVPTKEQIPGLWPVRVNVDADKVTAWATNRYALIKCELKFSQDAFGPNTTRELYLSPAFCKFILSVKIPKRNPYQSAAVFTVDLTDDVLTLSYENASFTESIAKPGNWPPLESLIDSWKPATGDASHRFDPALFALVAKAVNGDAITLQFGASDSTKPAPARFDAQTSHAVYTGLIQPKLAV